MKHHRIKEMLMQMLKTRLYAARVWILGHCSITVQNLLDFQVQHIVSKQPISITLNLNTTCGKENCYTRVCYNTTDLNNTVEEEQETGSIAILS
jgi:hypothetical protein